MVNDFNGVVAIGKFRLLLPQLRWSERLALWVRDCSHGTVTVGSMNVGNFIVRKGYLKDLMYLIFNAGC